jgi:hypothetical protein
MSGAKRQAATERRERLSYEEAIALVLATHHGDPEPPSFAEIEDARRKNLTAGAAAKAIHDTRTGPAPGMLF